MADADGKGFLAKAYDLDASIDDIEDLPGFNTPPSGAYVVTMPKWEDKVVAEHPLVQVDFQIMEVSEVNDVLHKDEATGEEEKAPQIGDIFSISGMRDNKFAMDKFKKSVLKPLAAKFGTSKIGETLDAAKNGQFVIIVKRTQRKSGEGWNLEVKKLVAV